MSSELSAITREMKKSGNPEPLGDPLSGVVIVLGQPVGPRALDAIKRSLETISLEAYVTYTGTNLLERELLLAEPSILAAVGSDAAAEIDSLKHPLATKPFSTAAEGSPFAWKKNTAGLLLPLLAPALDDEEAKKRFWRAFLALRILG
ncbi:MAG: hypothetical protein H0U65_08040 [Rubrobacter sp.]|nr:hypothetical protein [Rubrobacter sp.]